MEPLRQPQRVFAKAALFALAPAVFLGLCYWLFLSAPAAFPTGAVVNVPEGSSLRALSRALKDQRVIRSRAAFEAFVIAYGGERHLLPGDYQYPRTLPVFLVARSVARGTDRLPPVKLTIPEGFTREDIATLAAAKLPKFSAANFLSKTKDLEGYLFPDTYFFFSNDTEDGVIQYLRDNFARKIAPLAADIAASGHTEREIVTMASIIEGEAEGDQDRAVISGILWKRLAAGMRLEVDAAPSTYDRDGLPSAPVSNPGLAAIQAAIHPVASPYFFYLHDRDGAIHYARTFEEHKANKAKYLQ